MKMTYAIHAKYNFYAGTLNVKTDGVLHDDYDYSVIAFAKKDDADALCKMINDQGSGPSMLSYGQYAPAEYSVRDSAAKGQYLKWVMQHLGLQYDFKIDGSRIDLVIE
jgi:hypothetical protein